MNFKFYHLCITLLLVTNTVSIVNSADTIDYDTVSKSSNEINANNLNTCIIKDYEFYRNYNIILDGDVNKLIVEHNHRTLAKLKYFSRTNKSNSDIIKNTIDDLITITSEILLLLDDNINSDCLQYIQYYTNTLKSLLVKTKKNKHNKLIVKVIQFYIECSNIVYEKIQDYLKK